MPPRSDLEYWNRRESPGAIFSNLRWNLEPTSVPTPDRPRSG